MTHNYTFFYILDTPGNLDELYSYEDIVTGNEISGMEGEEPSPDCIKRILDYAAH